MRRQFIPPLRGTVARRARPPASFATGPPSPLPQATVAKAAAAVASLQRHLAVTRVAERAANLGRSLEACDAASYASRFKEVREHHELLGRLDRAACLTAELAEAEGLLDLVELGCSDDDAAEIMGECHARVAATLAAAEELNMEILMGPAAGRPGCFLELVVGAGGADACGCAELLLKMYGAFAARRGWAVEVLGSTEGPGGEGIKAATLTIEG